MSSMVYTIFSFLAAGLVEEALLPVVAFLEVLFPVPTVSHFSDIFVFKMPSEIFLLFVWSRNIYINRLNFTSGIRHKHSSGVEVP